jgi:AcrR family transcriptional regulator
VSAEEGLRERKRRRTSEALVAAGLKLFLAHGYEETTIDEIVEAAEIGRRTFFAYFNSKEELLQAAQDTGFGDALRTAFANVDPKQVTPYAAVRVELPRLVSRFETKESIAIDRLIRSSESLRARKQATFAQMEQRLFESLAEVWHERKVTRGVAMMAIGVLRLAMDTWHEENARHPLAGYVRNGFRTLEAGLPR